MAGNVHEQLSDGTWAVRNAGVGTTDSSGNPAGSVVAERPVDAIGTIARYNTDDVGLAGSDYRYVENIPSSKLVTISFIDGATATDAKSILVIFNPLGTTAAQRAASAEIALSADVAAGTTADSAMDSAQTHTVLLGERRTFPFQAGSECTSIYIAADAALNAKNNHVKVEVTI